MLYFVWTDSLFYDTRLRHVLHSWGTQVPQGELFFVGDAPLVEAGIQLVQTDCERKSHWAGACCKYGKSLLHAYKIMAQNASFSWAYFVDDDAYVRPRELEKVLAAQAPATSPEGGLFLGLWGCKSKLCPAGLCGSGGYAVDREAVFAAAHGREERMQREQMMYCDICSSWADLAIAQIFLNVRAEIRGLNGAYGNKLTKQELENTLKGGSEPITYHYIRGERAFTALHALFTGINLTGPIASPEFCVTYRARTECVTSPDTPWKDDHKLSLATTSRVPKVNRSR